MDLFVGLLSSPLETITVEPLHKKTNNMHVLKQRHRSDWCAVIANNDLQVNSPAQLIITFIFATYNSSSTYFQNFKILAFFCGCIGEFVSHLVGTSDCLSCHAAMLLTVYDVYSSVGPLIIIFPNSHTLSMYVIIFSNLVTNTIM